MGSTSIVALSIMPARFALSCGTDASLLGKILCSLLLQCMACVHWISPEAGDLKLLGHIFENGLAMMDAVATKSMQLVHRYVLHCLCDCCLSMDPIATAVQQTGVVCLSSASLSLSTLDWQCSRPRDRRALHL